MTTDPHADPVSYDGQVAIVTGAGGGLGRAHALELARRGARVVVNDVEDPSGTVADIAALGGEAVGDSNSVATAEGGAALVATALDAFGDLHVVVNNAGILRDKSFAGQTDELIDPVLDVHLKGAFNVTRPAWAQFRANGYGRIVCTTSSSGLLGNFGQANYAAAKAGVVGLVRVLAVEGRRYGITANAVSPMARTRMTEGMLGELDGHLGPELVSPVVAWLGSRGCEVTGEVYSVGGGLVRRYFTGLTTGVFSPELSAEELRDRWDEVRDERGATIPQGVEEELARLLAELAAVAPAPAQGS